MSLLQVPGLQPAAVRQRRPGERGGGRAVQPGGRPGRARRRGVPRARAAPGQGVEQQDQGQARRLLPIGRHQRCEAMSTIIPEDVDIAPNHLNDLLIILLLSSAQPCDLFVFLVDGLCQLRDLFFVELLGCLLLHFICGYIGAEVLCNLPCEELVRSWRYSKIFFNLI